MMFKEVTLTGTPYERGQQYGAACKKEIALGMRTYEGLFARHRNMTWEQARKLSLLYLPAIRELDEGYVLQGTKCSKETVTYETKVVAKSEDNDYSHVMIEGASKATILGVEEVQTKKYSSMKGYDLIVDVADNAKLENNNQELSNQAVEFLEAVKELNYIPNTTASNLSSKNKEKVALYIYINDEKQAVDEINMKYLQGAFAKAEQYHLEVVTIFNNSINKYDPSTLEYDCSKAGINILTKNLAKEFAPYINVNAVAPGWVLTEKNEELDKELSGCFISSESENILLKRFARVDEIAKVVLFLASDDASYINGEVIVVDGGC